MRSGERFSFGTGRGSRVSRVLSTSSLMNLKQKMFKSKDSDSSHFQLRGFLKWPLSHERVYPRAQLAGSGHLKGSPTWSCGRPVLREQGPPQGQPQLQAIWPG